MKSLAGVMIPAALAVLGTAALVLWARTGPMARVEARLPGMDNAPTSGGDSSVPRPDGGQSAAGRKKPRRTVVGQPVSGSGVASKMPGEWPWFRGRDLDLIAKVPADGPRLARTWPADGPRRLWMVELGEGYAAAAVSAGRVFVLDHVHDDAMDLLRGLSDEQRLLLASALAPLSPGNLERAEPVLHRLFPTEGGGDQGRENVSPATFDNLKQALRDLLAADPGLLVRSLRENKLDDIDRSADVLRCLSLDDGKEIWHNGYRVIVPRSHGMSRTIPAVVGNCITLGPQCHVVCWDAETGKDHWLMDLVLDHGATVPEWYAGQCPLIDTKTDRLILAPGGKALVMAVDYMPGKVPREVLWESPNPHGWTMTHVSITPMEFAGRRTYVYCGKRGVAGVDAESGKILWETPEWQISMATCPSPVVVGPDRIFLTGGYNAGSLMLRLETEGQDILPKVEYRLTARQFGCEQQTPVLWKDHLYGVRQSDKKLVCLGLDGKEAWNSGRDKFGSAPYIVADGLLYAMNDEGVLTMAEATAAGYKPLARARVIPGGGHDSWGPMALVGTRLIVRDFTRMVCLEMGK